MWMDNTEEGREELALDMCDWFLGKMYQTFRELEISSTHQKEMIRLVEKRLDTEVFLIAAHEKGLSVEAVKAAVGS
tara:strand:- start:21028 stop:21255 length:228 start_codon:yes stop_codon:yes gene_type:complete